MSTGPFSPANLNAYVGLSKQAAKGTALAPVYFAAYTGPVQFRPGDSLRAIREGGAGPYVARHTKDIYLPGLTYAAALRPELGGFLATMLLGDDTITGAGDPYTHTIIPAPATNLWMTLERNIDDDVCERIVDGVLAEMTLDIRKRDSGSEVLANCVATGLTLDRPAVTPESYESGRPFRREDCTWYLDNAAATNVEQASVRFRWKYDEAMVADAVTRLWLVKLTLEIEVTATLYWLTSAEKDAYVATHYGTTSGTAASADVYGTSTKAFEVSMDYLATGPVARQFKVTVPSIEWDPAETLITDPDPEAGAAGKLVRKGYAVKPSSGSIVTVVVQNSVATAYDA